MLLMPALELIFLFFSLFWEWREDTAPAILSSAGSLESAVCLEKKKTKNKIF